MFKPCSLLTLCPRAATLLTLSVLGFGGSVLQAAPYTKGDLFLGFVAGSGTGSTSSVMVNLGPAAGFRDSFDSGTNKMNIISIGTQLSAQFGANWYERPELYVSLFGTTDQSGTSPTLYNGDPARTLYVSAARTGAGTVGSAESGGWSIETGSGMTDASSIIANCSLTFAGPDVTADAQRLGVLPNSLVNTIDEYTRPVTIASFGNFNGGIEQTFAAGPWGTLGDAGAVEAALDFYRLQARNNISGQYGQGQANIGTGIYKGTFTISQSGAVSFIAKGEAPPVGGFDNWAVSKGLPTGVATSDDRDNDGITALTEYALDLNPLASDTLPAPAVAENGALTLTYTKGTAAAADAKITYQIEASSTLNADWVALTPTVNDATQISAVLSPVDVPGRRFARLKITQAD
jgi:hypothetical protein